jgi:hypothetical protein
VCHWPIARRCSRSSAFPVRPAGRVSLFFS